MMLLTFYFHGLDLSGVFFPSKIVKIEADRWMDPIKYRDGQQECVPLLAAENE